jgi:hypothetical protein
MLTGTFETPDGVIHTQAVGLCYPLVLQTWPEKDTRAGFDFNVWHDEAAMKNEKQPITTLSFNVTGEAMLEFIAPTQALIRDNTDMVTAIVLQMENVVKARAEFSEWVAV